MMKRVFTLLALAACVSAGQAFVPHRGGAQKTVGKKGLQGNKSNKVVAPKKCVSICEVRRETLTWWLLSKNKTNTKSIMSSNMPPSIPSLPVRLDPNKNALQT